MTPDVVVDVGNTRLKWGWWPPGAEQLAMASLPTDDPLAWAAAVPKPGPLAWAAAVPKPGPLAWAAAGVNPAVLEQFAAWAVARGDTVATITHDHISLPIEVEEPAKVGIDRLLNALAAVHLVPPGTPCVVVDVGTAVTADVVDADGAFLGGAILPGPRLMFEALHRYTAKLPLIPLGEVPWVENFAGTNTEAAITAGVVAAQLGAIRQVIEAAVEEHGPDLWVVLTGGGLGALETFPFVHRCGVARVVHEPTLTLEGVRLAAEAVP